MSTFVSVLGLQPAATVTVLHTLHKQSTLLPAPLSRVVLLATPAVYKAGFVTRVKAAITPLGLPVEVRDLHEKAGTNPLRHLADAVRDLVDDPVGAPPVVHVDPGPQHLVTALVAALGPRTVLVTTDIKDVIASADGRPARRVQVRDIGLQALLELHGLRSTVSGKASKLWEDLVGPARTSARRGTLTGFRFDVPEAAGVSFDVAYERGGFLFLLRAVRRGRLAELRATAAVRAHLRGLRPVIGIVSDSPRLVAQARGLGLHGLHVDMLRMSGARPIHRWIEGEAVTPGSTAVMHTGPGLALDPTPMTGAGGDGPGLVCWLGDDPSATLVCIASHRPSFLWLLVDRGSAPVVEMARRLRLAVRALPCGEVQVVASDTLGTDVQAQLARSPGFAEAARQGAAVANLSPGRKVQGLALARVPGLRLCTLDNRSGRVAWLDGGDVPPLSINGPPIVVEASVRGGPLASEGEKVRCDEAWALVARALFDLSQARHVHSPVALLARRRPWIRVGDQRDHRVLQVRQAGPEWLLELIDGGRSLARVSLGDNPRDGRWFEWLVSAQFACAGADEVHRNLKWAWMRREPVTGAIRVDRDLQHHRAELDVVARFGAKFVVVSCKAGPFRRDGVEAAQDRPQTVEGALREVEAVAQAGFGKFALPALAVTSATPALRRQFRLHQGAVPLDLSILHEPGLLRQWVELAVSERRAAR